MSRGAKGRAEGWVGVLRGVEGDSRVLRDEEG